MNWLDYLVLILAISAIALYGIFSTRKNQSIDSQIKNKNNSPWWLICLSVMATQASAITFISTPGMGFESGLKFAQFYFGLPIAMFIISYWFLPKLLKEPLNTAYQFIENNIGSKSRTLCAFIFLLQRGMATGITIYAPSIILTLVFGWDIKINIVLIGGITAIYTYNGGASAVAKTHKWQMALIFLALIYICLYLIWSLNQIASFSDFYQIAQFAEKTNLISLKFDWADRYNIWSGLIGGTFLMLSYFGTDQSQVQRYMSSTSISEIRKGLFANAIIKIPMQILILSIGVMVFLFYQLAPKPMSFDNQLITHLQKHLPKELYKNIEQEHKNLNAFCIENHRLYLNKTLSKSQYLKLNQQYESSWNTYKNKLINYGNIYQYKAKVKETDFVFIRFILDYLPHGFIGLLFAMIISAAMSSKSAELNSLSTSTLFDIVMRLGKWKFDQSQTIKFMKWATLAWGLIAILFAMTCSMFDNLVEFINIMGSLFYGTVLGVFLVAFLYKNKNDQSVFISAIVSLLFIFTIHLFQDKLHSILGIEISYLWYNLISCIIVLILTKIISSSKLLFAKTLSKS